MQLQVYVTTNTCTHIFTETLQYPQTGNNSKVLKKLNIYQSVVYAHSEILLSNEKELAFDTLYNIDESQNNYPEWRSQTKIKHILSAFIYIISRNRNTSIVTERHLMVA